MVSKRDCHSTRGSGTLSDMSRRGWLFLGMLFCMSAWPAVAQSPSAGFGGSALAFNGSNTTVNLPNTRFNGLQDTTVEGWIRFDRFTSYSRFFDVGSAFNSVNVTHFHTSPNLMAEVWKDRTNRTGLHVIGLLSTNEWCHLALVTGSGGMRLFFNGRLIASHGSSLGFGVLNPEGKALLGRSTWDDANVSHAGGMTEFRVWNTARTPEQIAASFRQRITVPSPGLLARWSLDNTAKGLTSTDEARLEGGSSFFPFETPPPAALSHPAIVSGLVVDADDKPVNLAQIRLRDASGRVLAAGRTGTLGRSALILQSSDEVPDPNDHRRPNPQNPTNSLPQFGSEIAGNGRFLLAIRQTNQPLTLEVLDPRGRVILEGLRVGYDERRDLKFRIATTNASRETTNVFATTLVAELHDPEPWIREMAAIDLATIGQIPHVASALAAVFAFDPVPRVRETAGAQLDLLARQSPVAAAALLEDSKVFRNPSRLKQFQRNLRNQPVPQGLAAIYSRRSLAVSLLFAGILGSFTMLHLFLFLSDRRKLSDAYTALFTGFGVLQVLLAEWNRDDSSAFGWVSLPLVSINYMIGLRLVYNLFAERVARRYYVLWAACVVFILGQWQGRQTSEAMAGIFQLFSLVFLVLVASEMLRIAHRAYQTRRPGSVLIGCGLLVFYLCQFFGWLPAVLIDELWGVWLYPGGMTVFVVAASMHLAREFVGTNRALREANQKIGASQQRLANDIREASDYVRSLLPAPIEGALVRTASVFQPSSELGGDAFGFHWLDEHRFVMYLLDVCGHGVGSALLSVSVMNALRARTQMGVDFGEPDSVLNGLNRAFPMEANRGQYFTMWYGVFDRRTRTLRFASGGHPPAFLLPPQSPFTALRTHGPPIGFLPEARFTASEALVPAGAVLHLISDGVYELIGNDDRVATLTDFERELTAHRWTDPSDLLARAMDRTRFLPLDDDLSALTVTFR